MYRVYNADISRALEFLSAWEVERERHDGKEYQNACLNCRSAAVESKVSPVGSDLI